MANTVLIIESDKATIAQAKAATEAAGYRFLFAETAADGLSTANEAVPSIILINLATPGTNGLEICKTVHNTGALADVPIILITLREGKFDPVYKKLYGIVSFLKKPFSDSDMTALLQEHSPLTEEEPPAEEELVGFGEVEGMAAAEEEAGAVFSIDEAQASLQDLQSNFQQPMDEEAPASGETDDLEGTRPFSLDRAEEESGGAFGEIEPSAEPGEAGGEAVEEESGIAFGEAGAFGEVEPSAGFGEAGGEAVEEESGIAFGEVGAFGEVEPSAGFGEAGGETQEETAQEESGVAFGEAAALDETEPTSAFGKTGAEDEGGWGDSGGGDESGGESWDMGGEDEAGQTMKMEKGGDEESTAVFEADSLDWGAAEEEAEKTLALGKGAVKPAPAAKKPRKTEESMPSFDDESQKADESFLDESMAGEDMPQMDTDEDYSDLFEGEGGEKGKSTGAKDTKPRKGALKSGPGLKRILIIAGIVVVVAALGFAGYTFFLAPEPPKPAPVVIPKPKPVEPAPEPTPAPEPPVAKPEKKAPATEGLAAGYYVQFGIFKSKDNAKRMVARVSEYGLNAVIEVKGSGAARKNFVLLDETIGSYSAATRRSQEVKKLTDFDTSVYRKK